HTLGWKATCVSGWAAARSFCAKGFGESESSYRPKCMAETAPASSSKNSPVELRRELGLRDLTLFIITCIVGTRWIPAAAHAGPGSVTLWLLAAVLFMVPLAIAVAALSVKYPGAVGLYLWTRGDFGSWHGFLCFWVYWISIAFWFPSAAMFYMSAGAFTLGPQYAHLADNRMY